MIDLQSEQITNITKDAFADSAPTWSPDGQSIVYNARVSGNEKLFRVDVATGQKTQLTFGTHDDAAAQFLDADTLVFPSTATDPAQPIDPDVSRNGQIYNVWTLNLKNGELRQHTDVSGNLYTAVLRDENAPPRIGIVTYYKGDYERMRSTGAIRSSPLHHPTLARLGRSSTSRHHCPTRWWQTRKRRRADSKRCSWTAVRP